MLQVARIFKHSRFEVNMSNDVTAHVRALVLDATPLITQSYTHYQNYAESFYTTPTVFQEIKDEQARKNLEVWQSLGTLQLRHPKEGSVKRISDFAKLTGDYSVLSANDIHILALAYELETDLNGGDWRLRKTPGDSLDHLKEDMDDKPISNETNEDNAKSEGETKKKKNRRRGGKKQRAKREAAALASTTNGSLNEDKTSSKIDHIDSDEKSVESQEEKLPTEENVEELEEDSDDGEWITVDNLTETIIKDCGEDITGSQGVEATEEERALALNSAKNQVALATGDFAVQNVALQLNLNLMNFMSGLRIKKLRNYILRCHACFKLLPMPKSGKAMHFCPSCGAQSTLLRCAVSVDSETGTITRHLKANFQWNNRGNRYSMASPLSKNSQKRYGKKGYVHSKPQEADMIVREDQKEYEKVMKQDDWTRKHNEKVLNDWIGGGSADNYMSPFAITGLKHHSVRVGRGRFVNSNKHKR